VGTPYFWWLQAAEKRLISCSATTSWAPPDNRTHSSAVALFPPHRAARPTGQDLRQRSSACRMVLLRLAWVVVKPRATPQFQAESMLRLFRPITFFSSPTRALFSCLPLSPHCELWWQCNTSLLFRRKAIERVSTQPLPLPELTTSLRNLWDNQNSGFPHHRRTVLPPQFLDERHPSASSFSLPSASGAARSRWRPSHETSHRQAPPCNTLCYGNTN
jgi:hypothetical protein